MDRFQIYVNLPLTAPRSIRVVKLHPKSETSDELHCELRTISLNDGHPCKFAALSYCWGRPILDHTIECDGSSIPITSNCHAALINMRKMQIDMMLWVDSICINQTDVLERNNQVSLMAEIYKCADKVYVWLGEWDQSIRKAVKALKDIAKPIICETAVRAQATDTAKDSQANASTVPAEEKHDTKQNGADQCQARDTGLSQDAEKSLRVKVAALKTADDDIGPFFRTPWSRRLWTTVEATIALSENVIFCDTEEPENWLTWLELMSAVSALQSAQCEWADLDRGTSLQYNLYRKLTKKRFPNLEESSEPDSNAQPSDLDLEESLADTRQKEPFDSKDKVFALFRKLMKKKKPPTPPLKELREPGSDAQRPDLSLREILADARQKESFDPKDKVFALYGVLKELGFHISPPDYNKTVEQVYRDITMVAINHDECIRILYEAPSDCRYVHPTLPSWVPDWSDSGWNLDSLGDSRQHLTNKTQFQAAKSTPATWSFLHDGTCIKLKGKLVDTIVFTNEPLSIRTDCLSLKRSPRSSTARTQPSNFKTRACIENTGEAYRVLKSWLDTSTWYSSYPTGESLSTVFCLTLLHDRHKLSDLTTPSSHWYKYMSQSPHGFIQRNLPGDFTHGGDNVAELAWFQTINNTSPQRVLEARAFRDPQGTFHSAAIRHANHKGFFTTERGYFGIAPARFEKSDAVLAVRGDRVENLIMSGDRVAVVAGLDLPVVLRRVDCHDGKESDWYRLVTHVYVHGIMRGEAWSDGTIPLQDIVLV